MKDFPLSRRGFLAAGGGLIVTVSLGTRGATAQDAPDLPGDLAKGPTIDAWVRISPEGEITVFSGKAELGQGAKTALSMVAAEELGVGIGDIEIVMADTGRTPDEGFTAGSQTMAGSGIAIRHAAAHCRQILVRGAADKLGVAPSEISFGDKALHAGDQSIGYGELAAALDLTVEVDPSIPTRPWIDYSRDEGIDQPRRIDIPAKLTGQAAYVHDMRPEGMVHARVVRPPSPGATLASVDTAGVEAMPGVVGVVRDGSFLAVAAETEFGAILAMRALADAAQWDVKETLPAQDKLYDTIRGWETEVGDVNVSGEGEVPEGEGSVRLTFTRPYTMHGSIGPSCAVALQEDDGLTVWSHTQGVYPDRDAIAEMLGEDKERVRVIHTEGAGCYGHNGADDAAADAALVARALPGRPVRMQFMREQEHGWEPYGPAMTMDIAGRVGDDGMISHWTYDLWSSTHSTRPGGAGSLLSAQMLETPFEPKAPKLSISPSGSGDRNADPYYDIPNRRVQWHFVKEMPLRVSALRALGAYANVFALESFMDELALKAGTDPVEFRMKHLSDPRARDVVQAVADDTSWRGDLPPNWGRGFAFARYKNHAAYLALGLTVEVSPETGRVQVHDVVAAIESGETVHIDGIVNQTEGGICQALSWTLYEEVIFDRTRVTSIDWASYPILRFESVPDSITVHVIDRPGEEFLGTGEAAQGPTAAAIGNAIRDATGVRMTNLPLTRERVRAGLAEVRKT